MLISYRILPFAALLIFTVINGCVSTKQFKQQMDRYIGLPIKQIQARFGYNYIERKLENNQRAYTWTWSQSDFSPGHRTPDIIRTYRSDNKTITTIIPGSYFPPEYYEYACEFSFIIDESQHVIAWRAHGNGCAYFTNNDGVMHSQTK